MNYSITQGGILIAVAGLLLVQFGFSEACSGEITSKLAPLAATLPGLVMAWIGRFRKGDVSPLGFKK